MIIIPKVPFVHYLPGNNKLLIQDFYIFHLFVQGISFVPDEMGDFLCAAEPAAQVMPAPPAIISPPATSIF